MFRIEHPPVGIYSRTLRGGTNFSIGTIPMCLSLNKAHRCHGSGTEVIEVMQLGTGGNRGPARTEGGTPSGLPARRRRYVLKDAQRDRKSTRLNSSHLCISYA